MGSKRKGNACLALLLLLLALSAVTAFVFKEVKVTAVSLITNTVTSYSAFYDRTQTTTFGPTAWNTTFLNASSIATLAFPSNFSLNASVITCSYQLNQTGAFLPGSCTVSGTQITLSNFLTASTTLSYLTLTITNILNPFPGGKTGVFSGTVGSDSSYIKTNTDTQVNIAPAPATCSFTFLPAYVYSTANMIFTMTTTNVFPLNNTVGTILIQFPSTKLWSAELDASRTMPITTLGMVCNSQSANINSAVQCAGSSTTNASVVTLTNVVSTQLAAGTTISFSINNFISPPTNQAVDGIVVTTYIGGAVADSCTAYVGGLLPKTIDSGSFLITDDSDLQMQVNKVYTIKFNFNALDIFGGSDSIIITFPAGTSLSGFTYDQVGGSNSYSSSSSYLSQTLTLYPASSSATFYPADNPFFIKVPSFNAPPSTQQTANFTLTILNSGYPKMISSQSISATVGTLTGTATPVSTIVNVVTSYVFAITTTGSLTSGGRVKLTLPSSIILINTTASCASLSGSAPTSTLSPTPICSYSSVDNSITFSSLNSSTTPIPAQTLTFTVNAIQNPPSTAKTASFTATTFYTSTDSGKVDTGSIDGVTATAATIDSSKVAIYSSSVTTSTSGVSYYFSFVVANPIPAGGYVLIDFPTAIVFNIAVAIANCEVQIDLGSVISTGCLVAQSGSTQFNFSNPFPSTAGVGSNVTLIVGNAATNPPTTQTISPFSIRTYHSDGTIIALLVNSLAYTKIAVPSSFTFFQFSRLSNKNAELTNYTLNLTQTATLEGGAILRVTFPANAVPQSNSSCFLTFGGTQTSVACGLTGSTFKIVSITTAISGGSAFQLSFSNIRNPLSFATLSGFSASSKTSNDAYFYSSSFSTNTLSTNSPSLFKTVGYLYSPQELTSTIALQLTFELSQYTLMPNYLQFTLDSYFTVTNLSCSAFIDFVGSCSLLPATTNTLKITGAFNSSVMGVTIVGFSSTTSSPVSATYSTLNSFEAGGFKIDESSSDIAFHLACTMPCRSCSSTNITQCKSCYSSAVVTASIYFHLPTSNCYTLCPATTYNNNATLNCSACDSNCLNCFNSATFCTKCHPNSTANVSYPYLNITTTSQVCVSSCVAGMYPNTAIDPTTCAICKSPCDTCSAEIVCITCLNGFYLLGNSSCVALCPNGTTIADNITKVCLACDVKCITCLGTTANCTACNAAMSLVFYNGSCQANCPAGGTLAPYLGICTPCSNFCQTCSLIISNCTSCTLNSTHSLLVNFTCLSLCPIFYYNQSSTGSCLLCSLLPINCVNCSSASTCYTCDIPYVYLNASCLSVVPDGYVNISGVAQPCIGDCATCSVTTSNCTSCRTNSLQNFACVATCNPGKISVGKVCVACTAPCKTCTINLFNCTSCLTNLFPILYLTEFSCQTTCPGFTYANISNFECTPCISPCSLCSSASLCDTCVNGTFLYRNTSACMATCPAGFTGVSGICQACINSCKTCSGATSICLTCVNGTYFQSGSCVISCGTNMFIDYVAQACIGCSLPCNTCVNSTSTCTSCTSGLLFNGGCLTQCPTAMFAQGTTCKACPPTCTTCASLTNCSICLGATYLYNGACVATCPVTSAVILNGACVSCSTSGCYSCSSGDVCTSCKANFLYLKALCVQACPSGYSNNGTHCIDTLAASLTVPVSNAFPVPFSIAGAVLIIACLMSRLQFNQTYLSGAVFSLLGVLQWAALMYFLFLSSGVSEQTPLWVGLGSLAFLYLLNIAAVIAQQVFLSAQKEFKEWQDQSRFNRCFHVFSSVVALLISHKWRNILFCKLFTFRIFSARLDRLEHFRIFNVFSLISLVHSGGAIFAAAVAIGKTDSTQQLHYECIDVIVLHALNAGMAFFNTHKTKEFFTESTPEGYTLHKKNLLDEEHVGSKLQAQGHDGQVEEGYFNNYVHALTSKQALKFDDDSVPDAYSDNSMASISEKHYEEISVQALDLLDVKANITAQTNPVEDYQPQYEEISIQADEIIEEEKQKGFNISSLPAQSFDRDSSNFTNYLGRVDQSVQGNRTQGVNRSMQMTLQKVDQSAQNEARLTDQADRSIQKNTSRQAVDCSVQKSDHPRDFSIQKNDSRGAVDFSVQRSSNRNDVSLQPSLPNRQDESVSMSLRPSRSFGVQQAAPTSDKSLNARPSLRNQSNQLSSLSQLDEEIQMEPQQEDYGAQPSLQYQDAQIQPSNEYQDAQIQAEDEYEDAYVQPSMQYEDAEIQPSLQYEDAEVQPTLQEEEQSPALNEIAIQYEPDDQVDYNEFENELGNSETPSNVIFDQEEPTERVGLVEERVEKLEVQPENIRSYQEDLEERIRQKEKELQEMKRKVDLKEKINERKKEDLSKRKQIQDEDIAVEDVKYVEQRPVPGRNIARERERDRQIEREKDREVERENEREKKIERQRQAMKKRVEASNSQRNAKPQIEQLPSIPMKSPQPYKQPTVQQQRPQPQVLPTLSNDSLSQRPQQTTLEEINVVREDSSKPNRTIEEISVKNTIEDPTTSRREKIRQEIAAKRQAEKKSIEYKESQQDLQSQSDEEQIRPSPYTQPPNVPPATQHYTQPIAQGQAPTPSFFPAQQIPSPQPQRNQPVPASERAQNIPSPQRTLQKQEKAAPQEKEQPYSSPIQKLEKKQTNETKEKQPEPEKKEKIGYKKDVSSKSERSANIQPRRPDPQQREIQFDYQQLQDDLSIEREPTGRENGFIRSNEVEAFSQVEMRSQGNKESVSTKKHFFPRNQIAIDVSEIDRSLAGEDIEEELEEGREPAGIVSHNKPRPRPPSRSPSDMSGTIEEIPRHYSRVDDQKTLAHNEPATARVDPNRVTNYFAGNLANHVGRSNKPMPSEQEPGEQFHINRLYSKGEPQARSREESFPQKLPQREKKSTLALAGRAQLHEDVVQRRGTQGNNPLQTRKQWEAQHQDKFVSDDEPDLRRADRTNLARRPNPKQLQNFASHLVLPQQSDQQDTSFRPQKEDRRVGRGPEVGRGQQVDQIEVHFQAEQMSQDLSAKGKNVSPQMPRAYTRRQTSNAGESSLYGDESEDVDYRQMMILGQMQNRPNNDDLQDYYQRRKDPSKDKKRSNSKVGKSTEKIYLQRLDKNRR